MAFGRIEWDGRGVIANCDGLVDSIGGTWAELGGGGISYNTDQYLTGAGSIGHVYASKSGFGYYTTNATYDFSGGGAEEGQFIYIWINISSSSAFDVLANNGFSFVVGTDTNNYRTYKLAGSGVGENNGWSTGWKLFVFDPTIAGSIADVGTFNLATINMVGLWMDTIVSVRADTIFIDQVAIAKGLRAVDGTGSLDELVTYCAKTLSSRAWGVLQYKGRFFYSAGNLTIGDNVGQTLDTTLTSSGAIVGYETSEFYHDTNGWILTHPSTYNNITLEKHASFLTHYQADNTSLFGHTDAPLRMTTEAGATYTATGGGFEGLSATTLDSDQNISNAVITACKALSPNGALMTNCSIGSTTETVTGSLDLINSTDLDTLSKLTFNEYTGLYALYIPASITGTITLNNFVGDGSGTDVYWAGTSGTLIINKSNGTNFSTWASGGGIVSLVSSVSIGVNVKDQSAGNVVGALVYIDEDLGSAGDIVNTTTDVNGDVATSYSGGATSATVRVRKYGFKPYVGTISLASDSQTNVTLITDPQQT